MKASETSNASLWTSHSPSPIKFNHLIMNLLKSENYDFLLKYLSNFSFLIINLFSAKHLVVSILSPFLLFIFIILLFCYLVCLDNQWKMNNFPNYKSSLYSNLNEKKHWDILAHFSKTCSTIIFIFNVVRLNFLAVPFKNRKTKS